MLLPLNVNISLKNHFIWLNGANVDKSNAFVDLQNAINVHEIPNNYSLSLVTLCVAHTHTHTSKCRAVAKQKQSEISNEKRISKNRCTNCCSSEWFIAQCVKLKLNCVLSRTRTIHLCRLIAIHTLRVAKENRTRRKRKRRRRKKLLGSWSLKRQQSEWVSESVAKEEKKGNGSSSNQHQNNKRDIYCVVLNGCLLTLMYIYTVIETVCYGQPSACSALFSLSPSFSSVLKSDCVLPL